MHQNPFGYLHGHSVGGTNPSLLEALASTPLNLLYDVKFNREVAQDGALYWTLDDGNLLSLLESAEHFTSDQINVLHKRAVEQIINRYSWSKVVENYEEVFQ